MICKTKQASKSSKANPKPFFFTTVFLKIQKYLCGGHNWKRKFCILEKIHIKRKGCLWQMKLKKEKEEIWYIF
jgi:hypothetical protein